MQAIKYKSVRNQEIQAMQPWQYEEEKRNQRKANKQLRNMKQTRKGMWSQAD